MTDQELQRWMEEISLASFGKPFLHRASFNRRLRSTGGRYFIGSHNIEISWAQYQTHGRDEIERIIKHELCHYHLHLSNRGYQHRDDDFKKLLKLVGGSRYCQSLPNGRRREPYRWCLECTACRTRYLRKRKPNPRLYVCGKCRGKLRLLKLEEKAEPRQG